MRTQGRITEWNSDRGFGFIAPLGDGSRVFAHISEFPRELRRPEALDLVSYVVDHDDRGRIRATKVLFMAPTSPRRTASVTVRHTDGLAAPAVAALVLALTLTALVASGRIPNTVFGVYCLFSVLAFVSYASDKAAAQGDRWRIPESTLLVLGLLGGWPGAFLAQRVYRHKTRKASFQFAFWASVAANIGALLWLAFQLAAIPG